MSKIMSKYGGDIIQFLGNSLIVIWPRVAPNDKIQNADSESDSEIARKAT